MILVLLFIQQIISAVMLNFMSTCLGHGIPRYLIIINVISG